jgi:hypothetical protein
VPLTIATLKHILHGGIALNKDSAAIPQGDLTTALGGISRITGYIFIFQTLYTSLAFLSNVVSIAECDEDQSTPWPRCNHISWHDGKYALKLSENSYMSKLSLTSLRRIGGPGDNAPISPIYIKDNEGLCLIDKIDWNELSAASLPVGASDGECGTSNSVSIPCNLGFTKEFLASDRSKLASEGLDPATRALFNTEPVHPTTCQVQEKQCSLLCGGRGCWDFSNTGCQLCPNSTDVVQNGLCVSGGCEAGDPSPGYFEIVDAHSARFVNSAHLCVCVLEDDIEYAAKSLGCNSISLRGLKPAYV